MSDPQNAPAQTQSSSLSLSFAQGFILGQLSIVLLIGAFIKFFVFGEVSSSPPSHRLSTSTTRTRAISFTSASPPQDPPQSPRLRTKPSTSHILRHSPTPSAATILSKTFYNVSGHQPESVDWFNVLFAQTIAQLRRDALTDGVVLGSLSALLNGERKPSWMGDVRITEVGLGEEFPIFSNARVWPVESGDEEDGEEPMSKAKGGAEGRLQARMDVDLSDFITLGIETTMVLNYPRPRIAVLPIALSVSVVRFSGTLNISFLPASAPVSTSQPNAGPSTPTQMYYPTAPPNSASFQNGSLNPHTQSTPRPSSSSSNRTPTTLSFSFSPNYTLSLSTRSLLGSRSRLQDIPKIAQIIESQLRAWFEERCVAPRTQRIVVPSLWPRMKNVVQEDRMAKGQGTASADAGESGSGLSGRAAARDLREEARRELMLEEEERERQRRGEEVRGEWEGLRWRGFGLGSTPSSGETGSISRTTEMQGQPVRPELDREKSKLRSGQAFSSNPVDDTAIGLDGSDGSDGRREPEWSMPGPMPGTLVS